MIRPPCGSSSVNNLASRREYEPYNAGRYEIISAIVTTPVSVSSSVSSRTRAPWADPNTGVTNEVPA